MSRFKYLLPFTFLPLAWSAVYTGGWWAYNLPVVVYVVLPLFELVMPGTMRNLSEEEEQEVLSDHFYDGILYAVAPFQYALMGYLFWTVGQGRHDWFGTLGAVYSVGITCGVFGINVAHELGHRKTPFEQNLAKALLLTSLYMHFFIEHNRGHHARVSTPDDPATARKGESLYHFWVRSVRDGYWSAWQIENTTWAKKGLKWWNLRNQMLRFQIVQVVALAGVWAGFGAGAAAAYVGAALVGIQLLETVNYIEHYGLMRAEKAEGGYEKVQPCHSWNSNHTLGRCMLFELTRHSDHHANARRKYQVLRHFEESPQMPTGYTGMLILASIPPLWFRVMHSRLEGRDVEPAAQHVAA